MCDARVDLQLVSSGMMLATGVSLGVVGHLAGAALLRTTNETLEQGRSVGYGLHKWLNLCDPNVHPCAWIGIDLPEEKQASESKLLTEVCEHACLHRHADKISINRFEMRETTGRYDNRKGE